MGDATTLLVSVLALRVILGKAVTPSQRSFKFVRISGLNCDVCMTQMSWGILYRDKNRFIFTVFIFASSTLKTVSFTQIILSNCCIHKSEKHS